MLTVKQIAAAAGVSGRTIRHYDDKELLSPARIGANGYRYYGEAEILRLQQILFYRELGFSLEEIKAVLDKKDFNLFGALQSHRRDLKAGIRRLEQLIKTVDNTILHLNEGMEMKAEDVFKGFSEEEEKEYALEAEMNYDPLIVKDSNRRWQGYGKEKQARILAESNKIYNDFRNVIAEGPNSPAAAAVVERWRKNIEYFWVPALEQLLPLAETYESDPRFKKNFDKIDPRLAEFIGRAVKAYVEMLI